MSDATINVEHISDPTVIVGHRDFIETIGKSIIGGRMHHAWLLVGPRGIGKASVARLMAAWLLSEEFSDIDLFNGKVTRLSVLRDDPGSKLVFNGAHPDYLSIVPIADDNKSGQIKIDQIRSMLAFLAHKPARNGFRVVVIDSMDEVSSNGSNAMLKLLEEPPANAIIFLISSRLGQLPLTIRSRCRIARLRALDTLSCRNVLAKVWPDAHTDHVEFLSKLSDGAPGRAISLAKSGAADCYKDACSLLAEPKLDLSALALLAGKWGRGSVNGRLSREGAVFCLERLLRLAALRKTVGTKFQPCSFEERAINMLCDRHSAAQLAIFHNELLNDSSKAEQLYVDFSQFLLRQLMKFCQKTLP